MSTDILGLPFEINVGDRVFTVKPLSLASVFEITKKIVKAKYIADAKALCESLPDELKIDFMAKIWKDLPQNQDLSSLAEAELNSIDGMSEILAEAICKDKKIKETREDIIKFIQQYLTPQNIEYFLTIILKLLGHDVSKKEVEENKEEAKKN